MQYTVKAYCDEYEHIHEWGVYDTLEEAKEEAWKAHDYWLQQDVWPDSLEIQDEDCEILWDWCFD